MWCLIVIHIKHTREWHLSSKLLCGHFSSWVELIGLVNTFKAKAGQNRFLLTDDNVAQGSYQLHPCLRIGRRAVHFMSCLQRQPWPVVFLREGGGGCFKGSSKFQHRPGASRTEGFLWFSHLGCWLLPAVSQSPNLNYPDSKRPRVWRGNQSKWPQYQLNWGPRCGY